MDEDEETKLQHLKLFCRPPPPLKAKKQRPSTPKIHFRKKLSLRYRNVAHFKSVCFPNFRPTVIQDKLRYVTSNVTESKGGGGDDSFKNRTL